MERTARFCCQYRDTIYICSNEASKSKRHARTGAPAGAASLGVFNMITHRQGFPIDSLMDGLIVSSRGMPFHTCESSTFSCKRASQQSMVLKIHSMGHI